MTSVPSDAEALDVPCPHCGERPIEQGAKTYRVRGFLLAYQIVTKVEVGCGPCTRKRCWKAAAATGLTGWLSITSAIVNPFAIVYDVGRGFVNRGPSDGLVEMLEESGVEVDFLSDSDDFQPGAHVADEALVQGLAKLGCAVMLADGEADPEEAELVREELSGIARDHDESDLETLVQETARENPSVEEVGNALGQFLTEEGKEIALGLATRVAAADGEIDEGEVALIGEVADELGVEMDTEAIEALIELNAALDGVEGEDLPGAAA